MHHADGARPGPDSSGRRRRPPPAGRGRGARSHGRFAPVLSNRPPTSPAAGPRRARPAAAALTALALTAALYALPVLADAALARSDADSQTTTRIPLGGADPVVSAAASTRTPCAPAGATGDTGELYLCADASLVADSRRGVTDPSTAVRRALAERLFYDDEEAGRDRITVAHEPGDPVWTAVSGPDGTGTVHVTVLEDLGGGDALVTTLSGPAQEVDALLEDLDAARAEQEDA